MTVPAGDERRSLIHWIDNTAGLGGLRSDALVTMLRPFGCTVRADRGVTGLRSVHIYGPTPVVDYLREHLDALLAELDTAAKTATRRYGAWLREQDEPDHMPAERRNLTRAYRRQYLPAWAAAWAGRLSDLLRGEDTEPGTAPGIGHTSAHTTAGFDVAQLDPQPLTVAATVIRANAPCRRHHQAAAASVAPSVVSVRPDGPGRIAPGQRITCLPGSLPAREGGRGGGILVSIGPKTSMVDVYGGGRRRISNELLHPQAGPWIAGDRNAHGLRTTTACGRGWLPGWSWLDWTIAEHLEYLRGERRLPAPPPAPKRLVIVACGSRKAVCFEARAGDMYTGSYHRAARRAAGAITTPDTRVMILSARHGLLDLDDRILRYDMRLGQRYAITAQGLREQAEQLGLLDTAEVVVLAPAAYAALAVHVWPDAQLALAGTRGIGDQMARLTALATGRATLADLVNTEPGATVPEATPAAHTSEEHIVSIRGGLVHLADTPHGRASTLAPLCPADQLARRWRLTHAPITCTRCATVVARRHALDRWCAMVDRTALATDTQTTRRTEATAPPARTGPAPRRPAARGGQRASRPPAGRHPGGAARRHHPDGWRHVPARPYVATPLTWNDHPGVRDRPRRGYPRYPRAPIGRAPPRARRVAPPRGSTSSRWPAGQRPGTQPLTPANPLTPRRPLTRENAATRNRSANGPRRTSTCTTRPSPAGEALADPQQPATAQRRRHANTIGPTRGLDRTPEVRPVTDLTTRPVETATPEPALVPAPVNGAPVGDIRTQRHASRAEQERLSADAQVERRARAARLDLELREQRRAATRREREADAQDKQVRAEQRRNRRATRRARLRAATPLWAERALFVLPIMFPMAVAWAGQIRFAMTVMHWPLPAAIVFAAGFELSTAYVARLDWRSRAAGDHALLFRAATWGFAAGAAVMNYWHAAGPDFAPTGEAVSYGMMSVTGVVLWELLSTYRHRTALRAEGKLPATRPRFGLARWIWFAKLTRLAWLLALRDGHPTTDMAWRAALSAVDLYGSARAARKAVRAGRPVPHPQPQPLDTDDGTDDAGTDDTAGTVNPERVSDDSAPPADTTDPDPGTAGNEPTHRDSEPSGPRVPVDPERPDENPATGNPRDSHPDQTDATDANGRNHARADAAPAPSKRSIDGAVRAQMEVYARARLAEGTPITGADLDRQFGTSDYGRKVLRRLTAASGNALR